MSRGDSILIPSSALLHSYSAGARFSYIFITLLNLTFRHKVVELPLNMSNPLDFITRRKELATQTAGERRPVIETPEMETPTSGQAIFFNKPSIATGSTTPVILSEANSAATGDTTESMIKELSDALGGVNLSSLEEAA